MHGVTCDEAKRHCFVFPRLPLHTANTTTSMSLLAASPQLVWSCSVTAGREWEVAHLEASARTVCCPATASTHGRNAVATMQLRQKQRNTITSTATTSEGGIPEHHLLRHVRLVAHVPHVWRVDVLLAEAQLLHELGGRVAYVQRHGIRGVVFHQRLGTVSTAKTSITLHSTCARDETEKTPAATQSGQLHTRYGD